MKIVVTGGTGFVGGRLAQRLRQQGFDVVIVSRTCGHDIRRIESFREVLTGARLVFHLAALVQSRPGSFLETNAEGLTNVLEASLRAGVERVVCVSSFTVFGPSAGDPHTEDDLMVRSTFFHGYDQSKYEALQIARAWKKRLAVNIVFPTVVFGPGKLTEGNLLVHLFRRWMKMHLAPLPLGGEPVWNFVFVDDVVEGLLKVAQGGAGEDYVLGGANCSLAELCLGLERISGVRIRPVGLSSSFFKLSSYLEDYISRIGRFPPLVVPSTASFFLNHWEFSSGKAGRLLGYLPRGLEEGLELTIRWMRERDLV